VKLPPTVCLHLESVKAVDYFVYFSHVIVLQFLCVCYTCCQYTVDVMAIPSKRMS